MNESRSYYNSDIIKLGAEFGFKNRFRYEKIEVLFEEEEKFNKGNLDRIPVVDTPKTVISKNDIIEVNLRMPVISGIQNKTVQQLINNNIGNDIMEFKAQMETAAKEGSEEAKKMGRPFIPYVASNNYIITFDKNNILSISVLYHEYVNGKDVYIRSSYNYDINSGKPLGLRELFNTGVPYKQLIDSEIRNQIKANPNLYPAGAVENFKGIAEDQPYFLEGDNIVINFGFNQLAPAISEIPVIRIPISKFKNQLKPEYFS